MVSDCKTDYVKVDLERKLLENITVDSLISGHHRGNDFCPLIGGVYFRPFMA